MWLLDLLDKADRVPTSPKSGGKVQRQWVDLLSFTRIQQEVPQHWRYA
jgi:hypothetical protein